VTTTECWFGSNLWCVVSCRDASTRYWKWLLKLTANTSNMMSLKRRWVVCTKKTKQSRLALTTTKQVQSTKASGKVAWGTERALWFGQIRHAMKASGSIIRLVEEGSSSIPTATSTMGIGSTTKPTVMVSTPMWRVHVTKDSGKRTSKTARGSKLGLRVLSTKVITWCQRKRDRVSIRGRMDPLMKVSGLTTKLTASEPTCGRMDASISVSGLTTTCRGQASISTQTAFATTGSI